MRYTDLIFDLYGTLVDIHTEETDTVWEKTALFFGYCGAAVTGKALKRDFHTAMAARQARAGQSYECFPDIPFEPVMAQLLRERGVTEHAEELGLQAARLFRIASTDYIRLYPAVREALTALRQAGFRLWLLSNAQRAFTACELQHLGLNDCFDGVYLSSDYGCRKPDRRFFRALLQEQRLDPARCLMIGNDRETDIAGAAAMGIATFYLHTNLTPDHQAAADPTLLPGKAPNGCQGWEYEGCNWQELTRLLTDNFL